MEIAFWIVAGLLAALYLFAGFTKLTQSREALLANPQLGWVEDFPQPVVRMIGALELAGAVGLILPEITGIAEWLTPVAAIGLVLLQLGAMATHLRRHEPQVLPLNITLAVLAAFAAFASASV